MTRGYVKEYFNRNQNTISSVGAFSGVGIHSGQEVNLKFRPAPENFGIVFRRIDLEGSPEIRASVDEVTHTERSTTIGGREASVSTVEHLLAAAYALQIDNMLIDIDGPEIPIADGSSQLYIEKLESLGLEPQEAPRATIHLRCPISWSQGDCHIVAIPSDTYQVSYTMCYPDITAVGTQFASFPIDKETFKSELASCRTFALYEEVEYLKKKGLIKGGSLDNAILIKGEGVLNPEGVRFSNEMARHKVLDVVGDLSLLGADLKAHIMAVRTGHASNFGLAQEIRKSFNMENHDGQLSYTF